MPTYWTGAPGGHDPHDEYRPFGTVLPDPSEQLQPFLPTGWLTMRSSARRWMVYGPHRLTGPSADSAVLVGELVWLHDHRWGVQAVGEVLAWPRAFLGIRDAFEALAAWWNHETREETKDERTSDEQTR